MENKKGTREIIYFFSELLNFLAIADG